MEKERVVLEVRLAEIERTLVLLATEVGSLDVLAGMLELRRHAEVARGIPERAFTLLRLVQKTPRSPATDAVPHEPAQAAAPHAAAPPRHGPPVAQVAPARYVLPAVAALVTGYSVNAITRMIDERVWVEGAEWVKAPDGHCLIDLEGYEKWAAAGWALRAATPSITIAFKEP